MKFTSIVVALLLVGLGAHPASAQLIISEFRLNGTNGANDEFIEIYNNSGADFTVQSSDGSAGFALAASDALARFIIPNGTVIPNRGHYLGANSVGYSLSSYPAGNGMTATPDATYTTNISNGESCGTGCSLPRRGIALFNTSNPANFTLANRLDAVGPTAEANTLYKEGTGVRNLVPFSISYSYVRRLTGGCIGTNPSTVDANCTSEAAVKDTAEAVSAFPQDTNNNRDDFIFADTNGTAASPEGTQQRLGAPGPENLSSPIVRHGVMKVELLDPGTCPNCPPNRVRDFTQGTNATFGTVSIRRKVINNTGANVTRLRFRIVDLVTFPAGIFLLPPDPNDNCGASGAQCAADLRALTSTTQTVNLTGGGTANVQGTTLEQAAMPGNQPNGGGFNSSLSAGTVTLATPLAPGASINVNFLLGVQQQGAFRFAFIVEALP